MALGAPAGSGENAATSVQHMKNGIFRELNGNYMNIESKNICMKSWIKKKMILISNHMHASHVINRDPVLSW